MGRGPASPTLVSLFTSGWMKSARLSSTARFGLCRCGDVTSRLSASASSASRWYFSARLSGLSGLGEPSNLVNLESRPLNSLAGRRTIDSSIHTCARARTQNPKYDQEGNTARVATDAYGSSRVSLVDRYGIIDDADSMKLPLSTASHVYGA